MSEPISIMLPYDNRPKTVTISAELAEAYVALLRAAEWELTYNDNPSAELDDSVKAVIRAGGG